MTAQVNHKITNYQSNNHERYLKNRRYSGTRNTLKQNHESLAFTISYKVRLLKKGDLHAR